MERKYIASVRLSSPVAEDSYLHQLMVVSHLRQMKELCFRSPVTFLVGENGSGKSTLLEAIAVAFGFNAEGGSRNFNFSTSATHSDLHQHLTITRNAYPKDGFFLRAESFYNAASYLDEVYEAELGSQVKTAYGERSLHKQSHGESFLALVANRFRGQSLYLLDEPEAALSPSRLMTLLVQINDLVKKKSQFIIATHSPILMAYPQAEIYQLSESGIDTVNYRETEHYQLTRRFLEYPEKMLHYLLAEE
ncbi:AAA family ATPase [Acetobacterium wieringae]|uniref:AAA family ATPase n=1 Tax=Acetobacterium wieringae TaxID=52694 RepID=UPI002B21E7A7|nr:AAA family ATPase [Acetobacterium wieringae]MEA4807305.1 AAA family ATPase [Acetobacterium wieringae]